MLAVAIAGHKKSGKTALLALVAEALERLGKSVAVVKYSNHELEKGNADAFWFIRPGRTVVNVSPDETVFFHTRELSLDEIARQVEAEVVLLEGNQAPVRIPRILCFKEEEEEETPCDMPDPSWTVLATLGACVPELDAPHFPELDPAAAETLARLILDKGGLL